MSEHSMKVLIWNGDYEMRTHVMVEMRHSSNCYLIQVYHSLSLFIHANYTVMSCNAVYQSRMMKHTSLKVLGMFFNKIQRGNSPQGVKKTGYSRLPMDENSYLCSVVFWEGFWEIFSHIILWNSVEHTLLVAALLCLWITSMRWNGIFSIGIIWLIQSTGIFPFIFALVAMNLEMTLVAKKKCIQTIISKKSKTWNS